MGTSTKLGGGGPGPPGPRRMPAMRMIHRLSLTPRALVLAGLVLAGCSSPSGTPVDFCGPDWRDVEPIIVTASQAEPAAVPILCVRRIGQERIRVGFEMPAG